MDREIKFKFWDRKYNCFSSDDLYLDEEGLVFRLSEVDCRGCCLVYMPNIIPVRYTGLTDKNGVEIYEGDIVKFSRGYKKIKCVDVIEIGDIITGFWIYHSEEFTNDNVDTDTIEVIGNIYDNPELLNSGEEYDE